MEFVDYLDLKKGLEILPVTWYPDIITHLIETAHKRNVFLRNGASRLAYRVERELVEQKIGMTRTIIPKRECNIHDAYIKDGVWRCHKCTWKMERKNGKGFTRTRRTNEGRR